jgi:hypothetical protein
MSVDTPPRPTARTILKAVIWDRWAGLVTLLWGIYGFLSWLDGKSASWFSPQIKAVWDVLYKLPSLTLRTWIMIAFGILTVVSLHGGYRFALGYSKRWEELTKHKLTFEVDLRNTKIRIEETNSAIRVFGALKLRFENKSTTSLAMKNLNITLHRQAIKKVRPAADIFTLFAILRISMNDTPIPKNQFEGMEIQGNRLTSFYLIEFMLAIEDEEIIKKAQDLDVITYLQVSMQSSGYQPEFVTDLYPNWDGALTAEGTEVMFITGDASYIRKDYRRLDE